MAPPDPHDAQAVLRGLARQVTRALRRLSPELRCLRLLPRVDGSAAITLRAGGRELNLDWVAPPTASPSATGATHWGALVGPEVEAPVRRAVERALARALEAPAFALMPFLNRNLSQLCYGDAVVDTLLAGRFAPGHTRWFGWTLAEVFQGAADRFALHFDGTSGRLTLAVTAPNVTVESAELIAECPQFRLWLEADPRPQGARAQVPEQVERFVGFLLARAVYAGLPVQNALVTGIDGLPGAAGEPFGDGAPVSTARWGNPRQWHQFFSDFEVARAGLCGLVFTEPCATIIHGEPECHRVEPSVRPQHLTHARVPFAHGRLVHERGSREFSSVMGERDTVYGGAETLELVLGAAVAHPGTGFVMINNTCLPKMVGDDVGSLVGGLRRPGGKAIIVMNTDLDSPEATYQDLVRQVAQTEAEASGADPGRGLSLLGFTPGPGRDELVALCEGLGLPVAGCLGPELSRRRVAAYRRGALQVVYPAPPWGAVREELFGALEVPSVAPPAPFGLEGSAAWLTAVGDALLGPAEGLASRCAEHLAPVAMRFATLRAEVEGVGLAFVVDAGEVERLLVAERCYGVRLLPLHAECGFALQVFLRAPTGGLAPGEAAAVEARLAAALPPEHPLGTRWFRTPEELDDLLAGGGLHLVYSEVTCDDRLARHGLLGCGLDLWELGPAGALRGLERLHRLARWPFFGRYARFLPPPPERGAGPARTADER